MDANQLLEQIKNSRFIDGDGVISDALPVIEEYSRQQVEVALMTEQERRRELHNFLKMREDYSREHFISCIDDELLKVIPKMQLEEAGLVMRLLAYLSVDEGILKDKNGFVHMDRIVQIAGIPKRTVERYVSNLVRLEVLEKVGLSSRKVIYAFNKKVHSRNSKVKGYFTKIWLSNLRDKWSSLPLDTLGFLYRIIPYFNTYSCCLSLDPYEYEVDKAQPLSLSVLCNLINMDIRDVREHVNLLANKSLLVKISAGRSIILCVSPNIMYRKPALDSEEVPRDVQLVFKQASMITENVESILAYRRALNKVREEELAAKVWETVDKRNLSEEEKENLMKTIIKAVKGRV